MWPKVTRLGGLQSVRAACHGYPASLRMVQERQVCCPARHLPGPPRHRSSPRLGSQQHQRPCALSGTTGAAEAGIGPFKTRTFHQAIGHGACGWISDDTEAARQQFNLVRCSFGEGLVLTAQERWRRRVPITQPQREAHRQGILDQRQQYVREQGLEDELLEALSPIESVVLQER